MCFTINLAMRRAWTNVCGNIYIYIYTHFICTYVSPQPPPPPPTGKHTRAHKAAGMHHEGRDQPVCVLLVTLKDGTTHTHHKTETNARAETHARTHTHTHTSAHARIYLMLLDLIQKIQGNGCRIKFLVKFKTWTTAVVH